MISIFRVELVYPILDANTLIINKDSFAVMIASIMLQVVEHYKLDFTFDDCPYNLLLNSMITRFVNPRNSLDVK